MRYPLILEKNHLFLECEGRLFLIDTGSPVSVSPAGLVELFGEEFKTRKSLFGLDTKSIASLVGVQFEGIIGSDVLGYFDTVFDVLEKTIEFSRNPMPLFGEAIPLDFFMGVPLINISVEGRKFRAFFDTGAQISYLPDDVIRKFPIAGLLEDFYPVFGKFKTETYTVDVAIGGTTISLRTGFLPRLLEETLKLSSVQGIVGNEVMRERKVGYFPGRGLLTL